MVHGPTRRVLLPGPRAPRAHPDGRAVFAGPAVSDAAPVPLRLSCPVCGMWHLDEGDLATTPHRTHACQHCGALWAPAVVPTVGVKFLPGCRNEAGPDPVESRAAPAVLVPVDGHDPAYVTLTWPVYLAMREKLARFEAAQREDGGHYVAGVEDGVDLGRTTLEIARRVEALLGRPVKFRTGW